MKISEVETDPKGPFECYLHVTECRTGQTWVSEIKGQMTLDIETRVEEWVESEFCGELKVDGFQTRLEGDFYATIITDWRPVDSAVVWTSTGFWLKGFEE